MKKKLLTILMITVLSAVLIACSGEGDAATKDATVEKETTVEEETVAEEVVNETDVEYTEKQQKFVNEYLQLCEDYDKAVAVLESIPELSENQELVDIMNTLSEAIIEVADICAEPELLTEENMELLRTTSFVETYKLIEEINTYEETTEMSGEDALRTVFTTALCGADEEENTYWFLFDDEVTFGAFVILSADYTQSINVVGEITSREDGALVITDETTSSYIAFTVVEEKEDYLIISVEDANEVTLIGCDFDEAIETVLAIDEVTEIIE